MADLDIKRKILGFFYENRGKYVSGEDISASLGFSRANSWKYINKLRNDGYIIEAVPHLGYILKSIPDKLYSYDISIGLETGIIGKKKIYYYDSIGSTNEKAYELAENGEPEGTVVIAESQEHGKGRLGRKWISPKTGGVYISLILRPDMETDEVPAVTLAAAVSIIRAIKDVCGINAGIKWPNDVLINGKKVCGILTEIKAQPDMVDFLILGIGVNVNTPCKKLPSGGTSLKVEGSRHINRIEFTKYMLKEIESDYLKIKKGGFSLLRDECKNLSMILEKHIKVREHHRLVEGIAVDIDEKGALIVKTLGGNLQRVFSGDIILAPVS